MMDNRQQHATDAADTKPLDDSGLRRVLRQLDTQPLETLEAQLDESLQHNQVLRQIVNILNDERQQIHQLLSAEHIEEGFLIARLQAFIARSRANELELRLMKRQRGK